MHNASDPFAYAAQHSARVTTGALLVLVMGLSLAFVPVVLYPAAPSRGPGARRRVSHPARRGRDVAETVCYILSVIAWLVIVPLGAALSVGPGRRRRPVCAWPSC